MTIPEVVVFDLGKVLLDFDFSRAAGSIAARGTMAPEMIKRLINQTPLLHRYETGLMTTAEFYEQVRAAAGFRGNLEEFTELFGNIFNPIEPMLALHASLRQKNIPTYIFSNTNELAIGYIRRNYPFFANFDDYIFSYEHGAMKPDARLYEVVEKMTKRRRDAIIYVDDRAENLEAAVARGWQTVLQETPGKTRAAFVAAGLLD
jgi:HAD superfamily hydrolase (TIGR01509 family)